jgi:hypothetical protein
VCALLVVDSHPRIEVGLWGIRGVVELFAEYHAIELVEQCLVEALADAIGMRALHLGPGVVDILDREVELILVTIVGAAMLGIAVGQDPIDVDLVFVEERDQPSIERVGRCQWCLTGIELGEANLGVGVDPPSAGRRARRPSTCRHRSCPAPGAKGGDREEHEPAKRVPGTEPREHVTGAGSRAASRKEVRRRRSAETPQAARIEQKIWVSVRGSMVKFRTLGNDLHFFAFDDQSRNAALHQSPSDFLWLARGLSGACSS